MKTLKTFLGVALAAGMLAAGPALAQLVPGGPTTPTSKLAADCYAELNVTDLDATTVTLNNKGVPTVTCVDGGSCDQDGEVNGACVFEIGTCINQGNVEGCTPPASLDSLKAKGKVKGTKGSIEVSVPQLLTGSVCGAFLNLTVPLKNGESAGKGTVNLKAKAPKGTKPRSDADKITLICNPSTQVPPCPDNAAGGPDKVKMTIAQSGSDLDNGWTGISQNFAVTPNGSINVCLSECDTTSDTTCTANGPVGAGTINGPTFGAPLPLLASNVPVCVINRFNRAISGTADFGTGDIELNVTLLSDVYFTNASEVCPRCTNNRCSSGDNQGKACTVDATLVVAEGVGNKTYNLSEDCPPLGNPVATLDINFDPLTSGDTGDLSDGASPPCPRTGGPGINPQPNSCGNAGCGAKCTGSACVEEIPNPANPSEMVCLDNKGGISQQCCNGTDPGSERPCFPLENGGTLSRQGRPEVPEPALPDTSFPKSGTGVLASVFCEAATGNSSIDGTTGLPGPAALLLNGTQEWTQESSE